MQAIMTADEMRALEAEAIASGRVTGLELMERAGEGVVDAIHEFLSDGLCQRGPAPVPPEFIGRDEGQGPWRAVVLCGPGNNGGDGFVVARLLLERGWDVIAVFYGQTEKLPPDARTNHDRWCALKGGEIVALSFPEVTQPQADQVMAQIASRKSPWVIVDALFGIGLSRPIKGLGPVLALNGLQNQATSTPVPPLLCVAIDVPSGIGETQNVESGNQIAFHADLTVTFHSLKVAHLRAPDHCGHIVIKDIGL
jgi:hydroxyethylthiazole kinase-like uncharacterized protein yjeF